jgi:hypothetical protein
MNIMQFSTQPRNKKAELHAHLLISSFAGGEERILYGIAGSARVR